MKDIELLGAQWAKAAKLLGVECIAPFVLETTDGRHFTFAALLPAFGAPRGTLLAVTHDREAAQEAKKQGYTCSSMHPETRLSFDAESYKECLRDWGWTKENESPPGWYSALSGRGDR